MTQEIAFSVLLKHRPRRIAFLVDVETADDAVFDKIADFNVDCWGGRHNPIIPVMNGNVYPDYWHLLRITDPDLIYTYSDLDPVTIERLDEEFAPVGIYRHKEFPLPPPQNYVVGIRDQASTARSITTLNEHFPRPILKSPEPSLLTFDWNQIDKVSPFVRRNFGASDRAQFLVRDLGVKGTKPESFQDADVLHTINTVRNLVLPVHICADAPLKRTAKRDKAQNVFLVCLGDSAWNFIEFWNDALFRGPGRFYDSGLDHMWFPMDLVKDETTFNCVIELVRNRVWSSGQRPLTIVSYDCDLDYMRELAHRICLDSHSNLYPDEPMKLAKGSFPDCSVSRHIDLFRRPEVDHQHVHGSRVFIDVNPTADIDGEGERKWMLDLAIENPAQERNYNNVLTSWVLPQRGSVPELFVGKQSSRVTIDNELSIEVSAEHRKLSLQIPSIFSLFETLLIPNRGPSNQLDLRGKSHRPYHRKYLTFSDKGKYLNGVLGLFRTVREAVYFCGHPFWRSALEALSSAPVSEHDRNKVAVEIIRHFDKLLHQGECQEKTKEWLSEEILRAASHLSGVDAWQPFSWFHQRYSDYLKGLEGPEMLAEITQTVRSYAETVTDQQAKDLAKRNLKNLISELTARRVLLQGAELRCRNCLSSLWYHVNEMQDSVTCRGCRVAISLPAEVPWSYSVNELVRAAVADHGIIPVVRTLGMLFEDSRACFLFVGGVEVRDYAMEPESQYCEIDLAWVCNGVFGIAEIKGTTKKFIGSESRIRAVSLARPDKLLLAATFGDENELHKARAKLSTELAPLGVAVEAWGPQQFGTGPPIGWNTSKYSISP